MRVTVHTQEKKEPLGDLYGIFFEDINHAADGGLYGELVQNRAFEYSSLDHAQFRPLYAWEKLEEGGALDWLIEKKDPVSQKNPHYLVLNVTQPGSRVGVRNIGFHQGIYVEAGKEYLFSCYLRCVGEHLKGVDAALTDAEGTVLCQKRITDGSVTGTGWKHYELRLKPERTELFGRLQITAEGTGRVELDFVSLFPEDTYKGRRNGMRRDLAEMLAELKPKFLRFPGGCLVHDGALDSDERNSMYRWKNTIGPVTERPARRNNWCYHQTLGLGYYEYFQLCEDIGAKPLPVLPAGYNPHSKEAVPMDEMQPWIEDALDLIEFANGGPETNWGQVRCALGHPEPFGLEYLAIGNEEVEDAFFDRYALFHDAIRAKYPEIRIINSAGPFADGEIYERGWKSAREHGSDLIDEHYYQSPEWFLANSHRYDSYEGKTKVFLGEYASKGNCWYNALAEAAFMTGLEKNAGSVGLACYAPLFANADYLNWEPDLIWFNSHQVYGTPNYYIQKLFMHHQGAWRLDSSLSEEPKAADVAAEQFGGKLGFRSHKSRLEFSSIRIVNHDNGTEQSMDPIQLERDGMQWFADQDCKDISVFFTVCQRGQGYGFAVLFGGKDEKNYCQASFGGWGNEDLFLDCQVDGAVSTLTQKCFQLCADRPYQMELRICGRNVEVWADGVKELESVCVPYTVEPLYYSAAQDTNGDILVKLVNATQQNRPVELVLEGVEHADGTLYAMEGFARKDCNSFEYPEKVSPRESSVQVKNGRMELCMPKDSVRIYRFRAGV